MSIPSRRGALFIPREMAGPHPDGIVMIMNNNNNHPSFFYVLFFYCDQLLIALLNCSHKQANLVCGEKYRTTNPIGIILSRL